MDDLAVEKIFQTFDLDRDNELSAEELAALVLMVNPDVTFSDEQLLMVVKEMLLVANGGQADVNVINLEGLKRLYGCGVGDLRKDLDILGFSQSMLAAEFYERSLAAAKEARAAAASLRSSFQSQNAQNSDETAADATSQPPAPPTPEKMEEKANALSGSLQGKSEKILGEAYFLNEA